MDQTRADLTSQASAQQARAAAGLRELADQLGSMAGSTDQDGMARALVDDVARRAGDAASWLDQRDPGSVLEEARTFARRRPGAFLAVAAGVGVVAGRLSRSLVDDTREGSSATTAATAGSGSGSPAGTGVTDAGMPSAARPTRSTRPMAPDGTPMPIGPDGLLTVEDDGAVLRGDR